MTTQITSEVARYLMPFSKLHNVWQPKWHRRSRVTLWCSKHCTTRDNRRRSPVTLCSSKRCVTCDNRQKSRVTLCSSEHCMTRGQPKWRPWREHSGECLVLFLDRVAFAVFCTLLNFLKQPFARVTHKTGRLIEEMFTLVGCGSSDDDCFFQLQLFAGTASVKRKKSVNAWATEKLR